MNVSPHSTVFASTHFKLAMDSSVSELFDVVVLPGVRQPYLLGFQSDEVERLVTFPDSAGVTTTKPAVSGGAFTSKNEQSLIDLTTLKFQYVYHLTPENLSAYDNFTFPCLMQRWQSQPQRGELLGLSAMLQGSMAGFAVAECLSNRSADIISLFVAPAYRRQGIGTKLIAYIEKALRKQGCDKVTIAYASTTLTTVALTPLLQQLSWQIEPRAAATATQTATKKITTV